MFGRTNTKKTRNMVKLVICTAATVTALVLLVAMPVPPVRALSSSTDVSARRAVPPTASSSSSDARNQQRVAVKESAFSLIQQLATEQASKETSSPKRRTATAEPYTAPPRTPSSRKLQPPFPNGLNGGTIVTIPPEHTFGVDVNLANSNWGGSFMMPPRPIQVWLPPDYDHGHEPDDRGDENPDNRHPVLYVHDGENAIVDVSSWTGQSWRMAGALTRMKEYGLYTSHAKLPICVLLPSPPQSGNNDGDDVSGNGSGDPNDQLPLQPQQQDFISQFLLSGIRRRHLEYGDMTLPFAQAHVDFIAQTVKPLIDNRFRTLPDRDSTFAIGASLGGQASLHCVMRYPELFGGAACLSPCFGPTMINRVRRDSLQHAKIYLDIGGDMDDVKVPFLDLFDHMTPEHWWNPGYFWLDTPLQSNVEAMRESLDKAGVGYYYAKYPGARHNERAWAQRIDQPLRYLFGNLP